MLWTLVAATTFSTAMAMEPGSIDVFRTPKEVALLICSMVILVAGAAGALLSDDVAALFRRLSAPPVLLALAATAWTIVASMASVRPQASFWAPATVVCFAIFFCAAFLTARGRPVAALLVVLLPAAVNAALAVLQSTQFWYPWEIDPRTPMRVRTTGLIGNPNDLGTYLVLPALAAFSAGLVWRRHRWLLIVAMLLVAGLASAQSVTPFIAAMAGVFVMAITSRTRGLRLVVVGAVLALLAAAVIHPGSRSRFQSLLASSSSGELPEMTSFRIVPAVTAFEMFLERPVTGVGPGSFSAMYMTYKLRADEKYPQWMRLGNESFAQVHNDHMQVLAETGLPGYLMFLAALVLLALVSLRRNDGADPDDPRIQFARVFALPAAVSFGVLTLAQFPMQLTAPMVPAIYLAALCFAWTHESH
ncbi:MAG TPA: O-antigen ligase family protein [Thermoanaerobaculia bacterium]|nr:O-antigen ligase family protein [Thermoanaerobaculia bacterium]